MKEILYEDFAWRCPDCARVFDGSRNEFRYPQVQCDCGATLEIPLHIRDLRDPASNESISRNQPAEDGRGCTIHEINDKSVESDPDGLDQHDSGAKLDSGKPMASLLGDFGLALLSVADVCTHGAGKYSKRGWEKVENAQERYKDAAYRHLLKLKYSDIDEDSGLPHLAHLAWNILAILELRLRSKPK